MTLTAEGAPDVVPPDERIYVARVAIAALRLPPGTPSLFVSAEASALSEEVSKQLVLALGADSRVDDIEAPPANDVHNARTVSVFSLDDEAPPNEQLPFRTIRLNSDISFSIRVPEKNQPKYRNLADIPANQYHVRWNGMFAVVQWNQVDGRASGSGGHVALEVLAEAAKTAGFDLEVIACNRSCVHRFLHGDIVTFFESSGAERRYRWNVETSAAYADHRALDDPNDQLTKTFTDIEQALERYLISKTRATRVLDLEDYARSCNGELTELNYRFATRRRFPRPGAIVDLWKFRRIGAQRTELLASMWHSVSLLETNHRYWTVDNAELTRYLKSPKLKGIAPMLDDDRDAMTSVDVSLVRASLEDAGTRVDSSKMVWATGAGALGALLGAIVGSLLGT